MKSKQFIIKKKVDTCSYTSQVFMWYISHLDKNDCQLHKLCIKYDVGRHFYEKWLYVMPCLNNKLFPINVLKRNEASTVLPYLENGAFYEAHLFFTSLEKFSLPLYMSQAKSLSIIATYQYHTPYLISIHTLENEQGLDL